MSQTDQTFARLNTDDSDDSRPTSDFTAGRNLALEPGAVQAQRGNVLVPYEQTTAAVINQTTTNPERVWFVLRTNVYTLDAGGPSVSNSFSQKFALNSGLYPLQDSTYQLLMEEADSAVLVPTADAPKSYAEVFTKTAPSMLGYTYLAPASSVAVAGDFLAPVRRTKTVSLAGGRSACIGAVNEGTTVIELLWHEANRHRLVRYDPLGNQGAGSRTTLLEWAGLNLRENMTLHAGVADGLLLFLDGDGDSRCIPLAAATAGLYTDFRLANDPYALHLVKHGPYMAPLVLRIPGTNPSSAVGATGLQFALRYVYDQGEVTVLSPFSTSLPPVDEGQPVRLTAVSITWPTPPLAVQQVQVLVRENDEPTWKVAARKDRANGALAESMSYDGTNTGQVLTTAEATRDAEALWSAKAATLARGRWTVANTKEGLPTPDIMPTVTIGSYRASLDPQAQSATALTFTRTVAVGTSTRTYRYVQLTPSYATSTGTYAQIVSAGGVNVLNGASTNQPTTVYTWTQAFQGFLSDESAVSGLPNNGIIELGLQPYSAMTQTPTWHDGGAFAVAVQFRDALGRALGVGPESVVYPPDLGGASLPTEIRWTLPSGPLAQLPSEAFTYQLVVSTNRRGGFFRRLLVAAIWGGPPPASVDVVAKPADFLSPPGQGGLFIWLDIRPLVNYGAGYVFDPASKDRVRFLEASDGVADLPIVGQRGDYLVVANTNVSGYFNNLFGVSRQPKVEIYSPAVADPLYYECGPAYAVTQSGTGATATRSLSTTSGQLYGSTWVISRAQFGSVNVDGTLFPYGATGARYVTESVSPSVGAQQLWLNLTRARPAAVVPKALQQVRRAALIRFGGRKVTGTQINGLGQFDALSQYDELPQEQGAITRMTIADQTQTDGSVLFVNQELGDNSLSLGQSQIRTADDQPLLAISKQVIGGSNALRGGFGCTDPAGVVAYAGKVFFPCRRRAELLRYDRNGLTPLGLTYKASNRLKTIFARYASARITGCFDPRRKEYLLTFHAVDALPDLTLVYSDRREAWSDEIMCSPSVGLAVGNELVTWLADQLWRHTADAPVATFYGLTTPVTVTFITSQPGGRLTKIWRRIAVNSLGRWLPTRLSNADNQLSRILPSWFKYSGGIWRAAIRRDENSPGQPSPMVSLHEGASLQSAALKVTLTADPGSAQPLTAASLEFVLAQGQGHSS